MALTITFSLYLTLAVTFTTSHKRTDSHGKCVSVCLMVFFLSSSMDQQQHVKYYIPWVSDPEKQSQYQALHDTYSLLENNQKKIATVKLALKKLVLISIFSSKGSAVCD